MFKTAIFLSVICTVTLKANSLQCYVCYDCEKLSDDYLTSCDSLVPTTTTAQPTSSSTTTSTTTTSTTPSTSTSTESTTSSSDTTTSTTTTTESTTNATTTTPTTTTTTTTTTESPQQQERADTTWECFKGTVSVNGSDVLVRGCAAGRTNETCDSFGLKSCSFCSTDKCNGAGSIQASAAVLAVMLFTYLSG